jgi:hypothetical protein
MDFNPKAPWDFRLIIGLFFTGLAIFMWCFYFYAWDFPGDLVQTTGKVTDTRCVFLPNTAKNTFFYGARVIFEYTVDGRAYEGNRYSPNHGGGFRWSEQECLRQMAALKAQRTSPVWYSKADPKIAFLSVYKPLPAIEWLFAVFAGIALAIGLWAQFFRREKATTREQDEEGILRLRESYTAQTGTRVGSPASSTTPEASNPPLNS